MASIVGDGAPGRLAAPSRQPPAHACRRSSLTAIVASATTVGAIRSSRCNARLTAWASGLGQRLALCDREDERRARDQVDHVVLAQVDEGEAERGRIGPPDGALPGPPRSAGSPPSARPRNEGRASRPRGCRRGTRTWAPRRGPTVSSPTSTMIRRTSRPSVCPLGGPPRRRRRHRGVDGAAEVEDRRHLAGRAREALGVPGEDPDQRAVRLEEPEPVHPGERAVERVAAPEPLRRARAGAARWGAPAADRQVARIG